MTNNDEESHQVLIKSTFASSQISGKMLGDGDLRFILNTMTIFHKSASSFNETSFVLGDDPKSKGANGAASLAMHRFGTELHKS